MTTAEKVYHHNMHALYRAVRAKVIAEIQAGRLPRHLFAVAVLDYFRAEVAEIGLEPVWTL